MLYVGTEIKDKQIFAKFRCDGCKQLFAANRGAMMFCPHCGSEENRPIAAMNAEVLLQASVEQSISTSHQCDVCHANLMIMADASDKGTDEIYCTQCGSGLGKVNALAAAEESDTATKITASGNDTIPSVSTPDEVTEDSLPPVSSDTTVTASDDNAVIDDKSTADTDSDVAAVAEKVVTFANVSDSEFDRLEANDVMMTLHASTTSDPFYNVIIKGSPVAQIHFADQQLPQGPSVDEVREYFSEDDYAQNITKHIVDAGLKPVLDSTRARLFAHKVVETDLAATLQAKLEQEYEATYRRKVAEIQSSLLQNLTIAFNGYNKNFFRGEGHTLKAALWKNFKDAGVNDPTTLIEAAFEEAAPAFFSSALNKAVELMATPKPAVEAIAAAIGSSNVIMPDVDDNSDISDVETPLEGAQLGARLAKSTVHVQASLEGMSDDAFKNSLKKMLGRN